MITSITGTKYITASLLGKGAFGSVKTAYKEKNGDEFAYKQFENDNKVIDSGALREISLLMKIKSLGGHPNIMNIIDVIDTDKEIGIIMPKGYCTLETAIKGEFIGENPDDLAKQILSAVSFLHSHGIMHRDIKPGNILLFREDDGKYTVKIADFSISKYAYKALGKTHTSGSGTSGYQAPEIENGTGEESEYGLEVDAWSVGLTLLELYGSSLNAKKNKRVYRKIERIKEKLENNIYTTVLKGLLEVNPNNRLSCS